MSRMFELLLQMNKSAGGLDQAFEILRVGGGRCLLEPDLLKNIVRLVVSLLVPAPKKSAIIRMVGDGVGSRLCLAALQRLHELGNSLAFTHEGRNLVGACDDGQTSTLQSSGGQAVARPPPQRKMTLAALTLLLLSIALLIFWSALFSGLETALFSLKPHQLRRLEEKHPSLKQFIQVFRENPRRVLNVLLLGGRIRQCSARRPLSLSDLGGPLARPLPQWVAATVIFAIVVLLCDLIPKLLALSAPYRLSAFGVFILRYARCPWLDRVGHAARKTLSTAIVE